MPATRNGYAWIHASRVPFPARLPCCLSLRTSACAPSPSHRLTPLSPQPHPHPHLPHMRTHAHTRIHTLTLSITLVAQPSATCLLASRPPPHSPTPLLSPPPPARKASHLLSRITARVCLLALPTASTTTPADAAIPSPPPPPPPPPLQDVTLRSVTRHAGATLLELRRPLVTCDTQDRPVAEDAAQVRAAPACSRAAQTVRVKGQGVRFFLSDAAALFGQNAADGEEGLGREGRPCDPRGCTPGRAGAGRRGGWGVQPCVAAGAAQPARACLPACSSCCE